MNGGGVIDLFNLCCSRLLPVTCIRLGSSVIMSTLPSFPVEFYVRAALTTVNGGTVIKDATQPSTNADPDNDTCPLEVYRTKTTAADGVKEGSLLGRCHVACMQGSVTIKTMEWIESVMVMRQALRAAKRVK